MSAIGCIEKSGMWSNVKGSGLLSGGPTPTGPVGPPLCSGPGCSSLPLVSCSPLYRCHDTTCFRQRFCPDPFCQVSNNATTEVNCPPFPEAWEDATASVSTLASTDSVIESSFPLAPPSQEYLQENQYWPLRLSLFPLSPPILSPNPTTPLSDFPSPTTAGHSLPPEPFPPLEAAFPVGHSPPQPLVAPPHGTPRADPLLQPEALLTLNTIFLNAHHPTKISTPYEICPRQGISLAHWFVIRYHQCCVPHHHQATISL